MRRNVPEPHLSLAYILFSGFFSYLPLYLWYVDIDYLLFSQGGIDPLLQGVR